MEKFALKHAKTALLIGQLCENFCFASLHFLVGSKTVQVRLVVLR